MDSKDFRFDGNRNRDTANKIRINRNLISEAIGRMNEAFQFPSSKGITKIINTRELRSSNRNIKRNVNDLHRDSKSFQFFFYSYKYLAEILHTGRELHLYVFVNKIGNAVTSKLIKQIQRDFKLIYASIEKTSLKKSRYG